MWLLATMTHSIPCLTSTGMTLSVNTISAGKKPVWTHTHTHTKTTLDLHITNTLIYAKDDNYDTFWVRGIIPGLGIDELMYSDLLVKSISVEINMFQIKMRSVYSFTFPGPCTAALWCCCLHYETIQAKLISDWVMWHNINSQAFENYCGMHCLADWPDGSGWRQDYIKNQ